MELTTNEFRELEECEAIISAGLQTFVEVGMALLRIRDNRLYRQNYDTFEDYCRDKWNMARRTAYQLLEAAVTVENVRLGAQIEVLPQNERQVRPLTSLPPALQPEVWEMAVKTAPEGKVTAAHVQRTVDDVRGWAERQVEAPPVGYIVEAQYEHHESPFSARLANDTRQPHVTNNSGENEWYTPPEFIEAARAVMGAIDLDPASSDFAQRTVKASRYYTAQNDGLAQPWQGRVWMNPPYSADLVGRFIDKLCLHSQAGDVEEFVILVNNATETGWFGKLVEISDAVFFPKGRIKYLDETGQPKNSPLQGQAFVYRGENSESFLNTFSQFNGWGARLCQ